jgi:1,4-dihydroxy-2-naphthoate octaprenyltransferase
VSVSLSKVADMIAKWLRAIRFKFLFASVIAVLLGLSVVYWKNGRFDFFYVVLTLFGVVSLHSSIDLLNDYWDYVRGIDKITKRTKFSGGSGVLPDGILKPKTVYVAGLVMLIIGSLIGIYFVIIRGMIIAMILIFTVLSIYFYSNKLVDLALGEPVVIIKGTLIVLGTFYVQTSFIDIAAIYNGVIGGVLSASVLYVASFPDYDADRQSGRRTLVILLGKKSASLFYPVFAVIPYLMVGIGVLTNNSKIFSLVCLGTLPLALKSIRGLLKNYSNPDNLSSTMLYTIEYSRLTTILLAISLVI